VRSCVEAVDWIGQTRAPDFATAWRGCDLPQWMCWLAVRLVAAEGVKAVLACARSVAMHAEPKLTVKALDLAQTGEARLIGSYGDAASGWINSVSMSFDDDGTLWAVLNYVPPAPGSTLVPDWSDLATIDPNTGLMTVVGPITGPEDLRQVGMKGFAIGPPRCVAGATGVAAAPVGSPAWLALLGLLLAGLATLALVALYVASRRDRSPSARAEFA
jgi:hypothetical protein